MVGFNFGYFKDEKKIYGFSVSGCWLLVSG